MSILMLLTLYSLFSGDVCGLHTRRRGIQQQVEHFSGNSGGRVTVTLGKIFFSVHGNKKLLLVGRPESVIIHRISSLQESLKCNDRILLFSQSLFTLNLIEDFLKKKKLTNVEVGVCLLSINLNI